MNEKNNKAEFKPDWNKIKTGLKKYKWIMENYEKLDVSSNNKFQTNFNHFYKVRHCNPEFYPAFYQELEDSKKNGCPDFGILLDYFWGRFDRIDGSFTSKLIATVNPNLPVYDNFVLKNIGLKRPYYYKSFVERLKETKELYTTVKNWFGDYLSSEKAQKQIIEFDEHFQNSGITNIKKIDFILWQTR